MRQQTVDNYDIEDWGSIDTFDLFSNCKCQNSNFNWPRLGWDGSYGRDGTAGSQPWPIQIWNLKFEILKFIVFWSCKNSRLTIIRRPSTDHPSTARREKNQRKTKCVSNDRSRHDDQFCPKIVKIGAILDYFWPVQSLEKLIEFFIKISSNFERTFTPRG